jgi:uncharacterized membrane protein
MATSITSADTAAGDNLPIVCPACGGANDHDAVFCANTACHKALGEFDYVLEELKREARWHETLAERFTGWMSKPGFLTAHIIWFSVWILINTGIFAMIRRFDVAPFSNLAFLLSIETVFITIFVIITQARQNAHADKRAELDYEVNVRTYRIINKLDKVLEEMEARITRVEDSLTPPKT